MLIAQICLSVHSIEYMFVLIMHNCGVAVRV